MQRIKSLKAHACLRQVQKCKLKYKAYLWEQKIIIEIEQEDMQRALTLTRFGIDFLWYVTETLKVFLAEESYNQALLSKHEIGSNMHHIC